MSTADATGGGTPWRRAGRVEGTGVKLRSASPAQARLPLRHWRRVGRILQVLARHGFGHYAQRLRRAAHLSAHDVPERPEAVSAARRLRLVVEELGPSFVKFGQMLSVRQDLFSEDVLAELALLQDRVPGFAAVEARAVIEHELGEPVETLYAAFDDAPIAAASMAQVHAARLHDGTAVIVKVQRPGMEKVVDADVQVLFALARLFERHIPESRPYDPLGLVGEFADTIARELDFHAEAKNAELFERTLAQEPSVYVPRIYWDLTSRRVLTMAHSPGERLAGDRPQDAAERRRVAHALARLWLTQVFERGLFHGDLHPGNVFLLPDGRLCFHDFGIVGRLHPRDQEHLRMLCVALLGKDAPWMAEIYIEMGVAPKGVDRSAFARDLAVSVERFHATAGRESSFAEILRQFIRLAARHDIRTPRELLLVAKVFMQVESLARTLDPEFNMLALLQDYMPRLILSDLAAAEGSASTASAYRLLTALRTGARLLPAQLERAARGELRLHLHHDPLDSLERHIDRASNRLTLGLILSALIVGASIVMAFHTGPHIAGVPIIGLLGYAVAALLALAWVIAMRRSGRL